MPPRPILRSKTFWFGIFILISLCGTWLSSAGWNRQIAWTGSKFDIAANTTTGALSLHITSDSTGHGLSNSFFPPGLRTSKDPQEDHPPLLQPPFKFQSADKHGPWREWTLTLAWWFLILIFLISWSFLLIWRSRRMKHLGTSIHPPSETPTKKES
ncbi:hypothetical protein [Luteolibacter soli]|uniref:Transmembrane protein n=1 Tax=Luteolibacter soli TaxID=3135280 RepID=A0ABU9AW47_9BACT